jgi:RNA polymerase-binding transcription factor DksA
MTPEKIAGFKKKLEAEFKSIEGELKTTAVQDPKNPKNWNSKELEQDTMPLAADPNEAADRIEEYNEHRAVTGELEVRYNDVKAALQKIAEGKYGLCEVSGEQIEEDRLEANPAARTCKKHM